MSLWNAKAALTESEALILDNITNLFQAGRQTAQDTKIQPCQPVTEPVVSKVEDLK